MNNVYNPREIYTIANQMCYENKAMNTAQPEGQGQQTTALTITEHESRTTSAQKSKFRCRFPRLRVRHVLNILITITVTPLLYLMEYGYIPGTKLGFTCKDPLLSHKYNGDTVSNTKLIVGCIAVPTVMIVLVEYLNNKKVRLREFWVFYKECLIGVAFVLFITEVGKIIIGEHRPHFFDVCKPKENEFCVNGSYINVYTCQKTTYTEYFLVDTSRSFPSGHSSVSMFVAVFSAYIIQSRLPTRKTGRLLKPLLVSLCLTWGLTCSLTRIIDRRHHWWDVVAGLVLGVCGACYTIYYLEKKLSSSLPGTQTRMSTSTTTLLDVKNKDATSVII